VLDALTRSWSLALEQLRRDAVMVGRRFRGRGAPPLVRVGRAHERTAVAPPASCVSAPSSKARVDASARELVVGRVIRETSSAVTLVLRDPSREGAAFEFLPGQFFTVLAEIAGEVVPRNYSASNEPGSDELHLTIKRKEGGRVSGALLRSRPGDRLRVLGPFGSFTVTPDPGARRRVVLVAGGSGITPLASIARTVLAREPASEVVLVDANRREEDIILAAELEQLALAHPRRFAVVHVLEEPPPAWDGEAGQLDRVTAARIFGRVPVEGAVVYVCGPDPMRDEVIAALAGLVPSEAIRVERFAIGPRPHVEPSPQVTLAAALPGPRAITLRLKDRTLRAAALPGATLLEAGLAAGAPMPFSCGAGGCGACRVKLVAGDVELEEPNCLTDAERSAGFVLACVGRPSGSCTIEIENGEA